MLHYQKPTLRVIICCILVSVISAGCLLTDPVSVNEELSAPVADESIRSENQLLDELSALSNFQEGENTKTIKKQKQQVFDLMYEIISNHLTSEEISRKTDEICQIINNHPYLEKKKKEDDKNRIKTATKYYMPDSYRYTKEEKTAKITKEYPKANKEQIDKVLTFRELTGTNNNPVYRYDEAVLSGEVSEFVPKLSYQTAKEIIQNAQKTLYTQTSQYLSIINKFSKIQKYPDCVFSSSGVPGGSTYYFPSETEIIFVNSSLQCIEYCKYDDNHDLICNELLFANFRYRPDEDIEIIQTQPKHTVFEETVNRIKYVQMAELQRKVNADYPDLTDEQFNQILLLRDRAYPLHGTFPYLEQTVSGDIDESADKLSFADIKHIIETYTGDQSVESFREYVFDEVAKIQKVPDFSTDFKSLINKNIYYYQYWLDGNTPKTRKKEIVMCANTSGSSLGSAFVIRYNQYNDDGTLFSSEKLLEYS